MILRYSGQSCWNSFINRTKRWVNTICNERIIYSSQRHATVRGGTVPVKDISVVSSDIHRLAADGVTLLLNHTPVCSMILYYLYNYVQLPISVLLTYDNRNDTSIFDSSVSNLSFKETNKGENTNLLVHLVMLILNNCTIGIERGMKCTLYIGSAQSLEKHAFIEVHTWNTSSRTVFLRFWQLWYFNAIHSLFLTRVRMHAHIYMHKASVNN